MGSKEVDGKHSENCFYLTFAIFSAFGISVKDNIFYTSTYFLLMHYDTVTIANCTLLTILTILT